MLKFQQGNSKLPKFIFIFGLPAGYSCPSADICLSKAVQKPDGKYTVQDGANVQFRCFAASDESRYVHLRNLRWWNFKQLNKLRTSSEMAQLINKSLPPWIKLLRIHDSGDFFNQEYFNAWIEVAKLNPEVRFYAYTKSVNYWVNRLNDIPKNLILTASIGGKHDDLIYEYNLPRVRVVKDEDEAKLLGLLVDKDDSLAYSGEHEFALTVHNIQPKGSEWGKASYRNMKKKRERLKELNNG
jgi:hypothetical protein